MAVNRNKPCVCVRERVNECDCGVRHMRYAARTHRAEKPELCQLRAREGGGGRERKCRHKIRVVSD